LAVRVRLLPLSLCAAECGLLGAAACGLLGAAACGDDSDKASSGIRALVEDVVTEYERDVRSRCPCHVEEGQYASEQACLDELLPKADWVDCSSKVLSEYDDTELRATIRCIADKQKARTDCLEASANQCDIEMIGACDATMAAFDCDMPDITIFGHALEKCPTTVVLR
jgi:hypothetical protein